MKFLSLLTLATAALAAPAAIPAREDITANPEFIARQILPTSENGLKSSLSRCGDVVFIFARGSTEVGNMGSIIGPDLKRALESRLPRGQSLTTQGVDYAALLSTNYLPGGTDSRSEEEMKSMLRLAHTKCPNAKIVVGGYR
jgi:cutinase